MASNPSSPVPSALLLDFFQTATEKLDQDPSAADAVAAAAAGDDDPAPPGDGAAVIAIPPSLEHHRRLLLRIQLDALEGAVARCTIGTDEANSSIDGGPHGGGVSLQDAQLALRLLGNQDFSLIHLGEKHTDTSTDDAGEVERELLDASAAMNDAARSAFARSVLRAELDWDRRLGDDGEKNTQADEAEEGRGLRDGALGGNVESMSRDSLIEFCGLCTAAVGLPEVQAYLRHGTDMTASPTNGGEGTTNRKLDWMERPDGTTVPPERMERIHRLFLRAVGYRAKFAKAEMQRIFFPSDDAVQTRPPPGTDPELDEAFGNFLTATSVAVTNSASGNGDESADDGVLSDRDAGGVTRVVSVQYTERTVGVAPGEEGATTTTTTASSCVVPSAQSMDQREEDRQRQQLAMAREAATLQRGILGTLLAMNADERDAMLAEAKEANDDFIKRVFELPAGEKRVDFLQSIDPDRQKLLAMHKLWESYVAENNGQV